MKSSSLLKVEDLLEDLILLTGRFHQNLVSGADVSAPCLVYAGGADMDCCRGFLHPEGPKADDADPLRAGVQPDRAELL